jgi:hypothetical protein
VKPHVEVPFFAIATFFLKINILACFLKNRKIVDFCILGFGASQEPYKSLGSCVTNSETVACVENNTSYLLIPLF